MPYTAPDWLVPGTVLLRPTETAGFYDQLLIEEVHTVAPGIPPLVRLRQHLYGQYIVESAEQFDNCIPVAHSMTPDGLNILQEAEQTVIDQVIQGVTA